MTVSSECPSVVAGAPRRAGRELLLEAVFRPAASLFVPALRRAKVPPPVVVLANAATGFVAALALARGELVAAALLLQAKTLLDNMDGELARAARKVTLTGRYLDTLADLAVNAALFVALGHVTGQPVLAAAAFVALTLVLAFDFNATELYREAHGLVPSSPLPTESRAERTLAATYAALLGPLDRGVRVIAARRFPQGTSYDALTMTVLANLGLTTQLAALGVLLVLGAPAVYLWICLACLALLLPLQVRAERRAAK